MTDLSIDWGTLATSDVLPERLPDLFVGRPVILTGKFTGGGKKTILIRGTAAGERREIPITVDLDDPSTGANGLAFVWGWMKIADLSDRSCYEPAPELPKQIRQIALEYGMMSSYTAFIAVDSTRRTEGDHGTSVAVPVPVPEGVRYDTAVGER